MPFANRGKSRSCFRDNAFKLSFGQPVGKLFCGLLLTLRRSTLSFTPTTQKRAPLRASRRSPLVRKKRQKKKRERSSRRRWGLALRKGNFRLDGGGTSGCLEAMTCYLRKQYKGAKCLHRLSTKGEAKRFRRGSGGGVMRR